MPLRDPHLYNQLRSSAERSYRVSRAAAELAVSAGNAHKANGVGVVRGSADVALKYRNLKSEVGLQTHPVEEQLFRLAGDTATVSGLVLSAIALPAMARKTATSFQELSTMLEDPTATAAARLDKIEQLARAGAGTIFSAQGVVVGTQGTVGILSRSEGIAKVATRVGQMPLMQAIGKPLGVLLRVLLPVADIGVLVGEAIATRRTFLDPTTTGWQRARKVLDVSLASLKAAFWLLPATRGLKAVYAVASYAQLLLVLRDFWPTVQPALQRAGAATAWAVQHPGPALRAAGDGIVGAFRTAGVAVVGAARGAWGWVSQPAASWAAVRRFMDPVVGLLRRAPGAPQLPAFLGPRPGNAPAGPAPAAPGMPGLPPGGPAPVAPQPGPVFASSPVGPTASQPVPASVLAPGLPPAPPVADPLLAVPAVSLAPPVSDPLLAVPAVPLAPPVSDPQLVVPAVPPTPPVSDPLLAVPAVPPTPPVSDPLLAVPAVPPAPPAADPLLAMPVVPPAPIVADPQAGVTAPVSAELAPGGPGVAVPATIATVRP
ncbi:MAG: hypothetical protein VKS61_00515 [Candidatus Sericytochromatia bacterium]|nr:hypothetical protein [Candidatus Sericytochromatia bacterium]